MCNTVQGVKEAIAEGSALALVFEGRCLKGTIISANIGGPKSFSKWETASCRGKVKRCAL